MAAMDDVSISAVKIAQTTRESMILKNRSKLIHKEIKLIKLISVPAKALQSAAREYLKIEFQSKASKTDPQPLKLNHKKSKDLVVWGMTWNSSFRSLPKIKRISF